MSTAIAESKQSFSLAPQNLEEAFKFAEILSKSKLVPKDFEGNQGNILVAIQWGAELGLQPMQAMQNIAVINGRPSLWGDSVIALVKASPLCEYVVEEVKENGATCRVKRRGEPEQIRTFTVDDARSANLWGKQGPWSNYPKRMLQMRARSWALRDVFPDVLRGMPIAEELQDMPLPGEKDVTQHGTHETKAPVIVYYSDEEFNAKASGWEQVVKDGRKTPDTLIATVESKGKKFTDAQKALIADFAKQPEPIEGELLPAVDPFVAEMEAAEQSQGE